MQSVRPLPNIQSHRTQKRQFKMIDIVRVAETFQRWITYISGMYIFIKKKKKNVFFLI